MKKQKKNLTKKDVLSAQAGEGAAAGRKGKLEVPILWFFFLHVSLIVNSLAGAASKMAGRQDFLSLGFCFFYGLVLVITFVFALAWQQILKHMSLTFAFTNKPITILWGLLWGVVFFGETMTWNKILGSVVILAGIMIGVSGNDRTVQSE